MAWASRDLPIFEHGLQIGQHYQILFPLISTDSHPYPAEYASYVVKDNRTSTCKALRAYNKAASESHSTEVPDSIRHALSRGSAGEYILLPLESFEYEGTLCDIHELHGPSVSVLKEPAEESARWVRKIFREFLEALDLLHSNGVVHGDVMLWSGLVTYPKLEGADESTVIRFYQPNASEMLAFNIFGSGTQGSEPNLDFRLKLQNLRKATSVPHTASNVNKYLSNVCPPPEILLEGQLSTKTDIWSLGVMMADILACCPEGVTLFGKFGSQPADRAEQFASCQKLLGPLPKKYADRLQISDDAAMKASKSQDLLTEIKEMRVDVGNLEITGNLSEEQQTDALCERSLELVVELLKSLLTYDPDDRMTAKQALSHPFFQQT